MAPVLALDPLPAARRRLRVPGDKSISHRALLLNALAKGRAEVGGLGPGADVRSTAAALGAFGATLEPIGAGRMRVSGPPARWRSEAAIDCGNSGTTVRLLLGVLAPRAAAPIVLTGDGSLSGRPMGRVIEPLARMGASIGAARPGGRADRLPLVVAGRELAGVSHELPVASAQVKSALLLAGLAAGGETVVREPHRSRDHTERLLAAMGADIRIAEDGGVSVRAGALTAIDLEVPGDLSSAAPHLALAAARPGSEVVVEGVGLNPTRTGFLDILGAFGARVETEPDEEAIEPRGTLSVQGGRLHAIQVDASLVPRAIDELPLVAVLATQAEGTTLVRGAAELRVKESDRIVAIVEGLRRMGAEIEPTPDGFVVHGPSRLRGAELDAAADHRIGMALAVAAALADGKSALAGADWVAISYPGFFADLPP